MSQQVQVYKDKTANIVRAGYIVNIESPQVNMKLMCTDTFFKVHKCD